MRSEHLAIPDIVSSGPGHLRPTWCEIDLDAIAQNFATLKGMVDPAVLIFASLKRNASGCGSAEIARHLEGLGADGIAFGDIDDAVKARQAGVRLPILLYPNCLPDVARTVATLRLTLTLSTREDVEAWAGANPGGTPIDVFLKLDGGGLRAGALPHEAVTVARSIVASPGLRLAGVYRHPMATYGMDEEAFTRSQLVETVRVIDAIVAAGIEVPVRMVASSAIVVGHPDMDLNAVDPGRLLFGSSFDAVAERRREWKPVVAGLKSRLVMRKCVEGTDGMRLAPFFPVRPGMILGLIPYGWGDGYPRVLPEGASALIRGRRVPLLGPPHSELLRLDLTDVPEATLGDEVVLLGRSGDLEISIDEICSQWTMSRAEFGASFPDHLPRHYLRAGTATADGVTGVRAPPGPR